MKRPTLPLLAAILVVAACDDRPSSPLAPTGAPAAPALAVVDAYGGGPIHGAIFTTTPLGDVVNENVRYSDKREVYLDGGPPGHAPITAAGLPDGLFVFQITDPPGKVLLSDDPAKCRVVRVEGGVIRQLVRPSDIPGFDPALANTYGNGRGTACHVADEPAGMGASGHHDTNVDVDHGAEGAIVVQMMPFLDTPNPGGVYKAWMTPLREYLAKGGNLGAQTKAIVTQGKTVGYARDPGFAPPLSKVKTDNFKVRENPPFIRIDKLVDANRDGSAAGDASFPNPPGWPVTVTEPVDGGTVTNDYLAPTGGIAVPHGSTVTVCEQMLDGWRFSYALVGGTYVTPVQKTVDGKVYYCVDVTVGSGPVTIAVGFGNIKAVPKAKIAIAPPTGTNAVGSPHALLATVQVDRDLGAGWEDAPDGTTIGFAIVSGPGALSPTSCLTSGGTGACGTTLTSLVAGQTTVKAASALTVDGTALSVETDGVAPNSGPALKTWVDARIAISPLDDTNGIGEPHLLTGRVEVNLGAPDAWVNAADGTRIDFSIVSGPGVLSPASCLTTGSTGACTTTLTSSVAGTTVVRAATTLTVSGQSLARQTGPGVGTSVGDDARKVWITGSLSWEKRDAFAALLTGATFEACRIADRFGGAVSGECTTVTDNLAPDADPIGGRFKLTGLALGTWRVRETAAPAGYELDPSVLTLAITLEAPHGFVGIFVNRKPGQALTPGYWKNHQSQLVKYLPLSLGGYAVTSFATATSIFDGMNCSSSSDQDAIGCLAGHLLASKLNVANGASSCIAGTITSADAFLAGIGYAGTGKVYALSASQRSTAIALKDALDAYNNNIGCNKP